MDEMAELNPAAAPRLTAEHLSLMQAPFDGYGLLGLTVAVVGLLLFAPPLGAMVAGVIGLVVALGVASALGQAMVVANGVPIELALGPEWADEVDELLVTTGRQPGSVRVVVISDPQPQAFATWAPTAGRAIAISSGLVNMLGRDPVALRFVLGHELGHLLYHFPYALVLNNGSALPGMFGPFGALLRPVCLWWSRHGECSADRLGMVLSGSPTTALRVLVALHLGTLPPEDGFGPTVERLVVRRGPWHALAEAFATHPFLGSRLRAALSFAAQADEASWWRAEQAAAWRTDLAHLWPAPPSGEPHSVRPVPAGVS